MKSLRTILLLTLAVFVLAAPMAQAQTIGVYFGPDQASNARVQPFKEFKIWVILSQIEDSVNAVEYKMTLPAQVAVLDAGMYPGSVDFGNEAQGIALGLGECVNVYTAPGLSETLVIAEMTVMAVQEFGDFNITLTAFTGGEAPGSVPRYSSCDHNLVDMVVSDGILASSVATDETSWGAVKSLFE